MVAVGKYNTLRVVKTDLPQGAYLDGGDNKEILLPTRYVPKGTKVGDEIKVFIYHDNEGRLIATTIHPTAIADEFQWMECKSVGRIGAFLEWGLMKDLLVPFSEQKQRMREGRWYLVYVHVDHASGRIVASAKIDKYLGNTVPEYELNQEVDLLVADETEIGYKVIVNNAHWGLIYHSEVFQRLERGEHLKGYIKAVREDEKIDVSLSPLGYGRVEGVAGIILSALQTQGGFMAVHDKSEPDVIYSLFRCSKKAFKQALGQLYKQHLITIETDGIRLVKEK